MHSNLSIKRHKNVGEEDKTCRKIMQQKETADDYHLLWHMMMPPSLDTESRIHSQQSLIFFGLCIKYLVKHAPSSLTWECPTWTSTVHGLFNGPHKHSGKRIFKWSQSHTKHLYKSSSRHLKFPISRHLIMEHGITEYKRNHCNVFCNNCPTNGNIQTFLGGHNSEQLDITKELWQQEV